MRIIMQTKTMKGEWCNEKWNSYPLGTMVRYEGDNYYKMLNGHVACISYGNIGEAMIYHDWDNADGFSDEVMTFHTVKIVPEAKGFQGDSLNQNWTPMKRADKRGHTSSTTLKDIVAYLDGSYVGETVVEKDRRKDNKTDVILYKEA